MRNGHICLTCHAARSQMGQLFHPRSSTTAVKLGEAKSLKAPSTCTEAVQRQVERLADTCRLLFQNAKLALQLLNDDDRAVALGEQQQRDRVAGELHCGLITGASQEQ